MTNPTSNFGWQMPTSTDLVTDLPADFEVFGQAVDTSLADLKGGTTGQVLSKATNADMDFTWVTTDDANAIQNAIVDAKGDLIAASAADTPARLAVGANGETLVADSSTSTGLRYQVSKSVNHIINGGQDIWQRGTSFASGALQYTSDRFNYLRAGAVSGATVSRQNTSDTTNLPNIQYCARIQRDSGNTSTAVIFFGSSLESVETRQLQGQPIVLSFYARAGANFSSASSLFGAEIVSGTGTDQNIFTGLTGQSTVAFSNKTLTTTWQRFTVTGTVASTATQLCILFSYTPVGTAGAADYAEITGVQLELGTVPSPFQRSGGTIQGETSACLRYFNRAVNGSVNGNYRLSGGQAVSSTGAELNYSFPVTMRTSPTLSVSAAGHFMLINSTGGVAGNPTGISGAILTPTNARVDATGAGGLTAGNATSLQVANSSATLDFSAEL